MTQNEPYDRWDLVLLLYSLAGSALSLAGGISVAIVGAIAYLSADLEGAQAAQWTASGLLTLAAAGVPALWLSARIVIKGERPASGRPVKDWLRVGALFPVGLLLGFLAYERGILSPLLGPVGQLLAIGTPAVLAVLLVRRAGPVVPLRRIWGHLLVGMWAVPVFALMLEGITFLLGIVTTSAGLALVPGGRQLLSELQQLVGSIETQPSLEAVAEIALHPIAIVLIVAFLGILVPVIEELAKTATIWPLLPRRISGGEAFLGGALGGTGFALAEALFLAQPGTGWVITAFARAGATMMHALATGIASWALAEALIRRRWLQGAAGLGIAIFLHGLWNVSAIGIGLTQLATSASFDLPSSMLESILSASAATIVVLGFGATWLLPRLQRRAEASQSTSPIGETPENLAGR